MTAFGLRIIALASMLLDHIGRTLLPEQLWLIVVGRLAFPIFAFQIANGYQHTHNKKKYALRLLLFAILSEIPFDLMAYGIPFYWGHQNVLWTLLLGLTCIHVIEKTSCFSQTLIIRYCLHFLICVIAFFIATILRLDYIGFGVLQIIIFYLLVKDKTRYSPIVLIGTVLCNLFATYPFVSLGGTQIPSQWFAVLSLIPIFLYNNARGFHCKWWHHFCYIFYPLHLLVLSFLRLS